MWQKSIKTVNEQRLKALLSRYCGPENLAQSLIDWSNKHLITPIHIQLGKPTQHAYIVRFKRIVLPE